MDNLGRSRPTDLARFQSCAAAVLSCRREDVLLDWKLALQPKESLRGSVQYSRCVGVDADVSLCPTTWPWPTPATMNRNRAQTFRTPEPSRTRDPGHTPQRFSADVVADDVEFSAIMIFRYCTVLKYVQSSTTTMIQFYMASERRLTSLASAPCKIYRH